MTSSIYKKIVDKYLASSDEEVDEDDVSSNDENRDEGSKEREQAKQQHEKEQQQQQQPVKCGLRGRAALLALNSTDEDDDEDEDEDDEQPRGLFGKKKPQPKAGIYGKKLNQTKKQVKIVKNEFQSAEKNLMNEIENNVIKKNKLKEEHVEKVDDDNDDDDCEAVGPKKSRMKLKDEGNDDDDDEYDDGENEKNNKEDVSMKAAADEERSLSPPPPPPSQLNGHLHAMFKKKGRKSSTIEKNLKELELMKAKAMARKTAMDDSMKRNNESEEEELDDDDSNNFMTIRVSTKKGIQKFEMDPNGTFEEIFEKLAKLENTQKEFLILSVEDRLIKFNDTPASIKLKTFHIIDCVQSLKKAQERIRMLENDEVVDESGNNSVIKITLQTSEGRKSRVSFLIYKDEPFGKVLKMYCEKRELGNHEDYMIEFDGDRVNLNENAADLDLDGDEIFDVKKSTSKPTSQLINENNGKYHFDDDILIA